MLSFVHKYFHWLLSEEIQALVVGQKEQQQREEEMQKDITVLLNNNREMTTRRLTIDDMILKPNQLKLLQSSASDYRQALYDAGEMRCLTEVDESARKAIIGYRQYLMTLTLHPTRQNEIKSDRTQIDDINQRKQKFFTPRVNATI